MNKRIVKIAGLSAILLLVFALGVAAGSQTNRAAASAPLAGAQQTETDAGIVIVAVDADGPAAAAGVKRGDILLQLNDTAINQPHELFTALADLSRGAQVTLNVLHGDEQRTLTATLAERNGRAYLGVQSCCGPRREVFSSVFPGPEPGAIIIEVQADSPAEQAGLQKGDRILEVDGQSIDFEHNLADVIAGRKPGDRVTLKFERPGEEPRDVTVTLGEHPDTEGAAYLGVTYGPFAPFGLLREKMLPNLEGLPFELPFPNMEGANHSGLVVRNVAEDSPASAAGLKQGDLITAIDGEPVSAHDALTEAVAAHKPGDTLSLTVQREGEAEALTIEATLGEKPGAQSEAYLGVTAGGFFAIRRFDGEGAPQEFKFPFDELPFRFKPQFDPPATSEESLL
ncbi:MAG TPA: PDZ domain-containing protein [Anaerolineae bacterium]|nr:PDZ domain-containing protein [Anaerolineae bacterium]